MPIKGLSEIRRLPRVAKIRLGIKATTANGTEYPKAVDYFVVREDDHTPKAFADSFHTLYGDQPKELFPVVLPSDDTEKVFPQYMRRYGKGSGLICKGDGDTATEVDKQGEMFTHTCDPANCEWVKSKHCKATATLSAMLPKVKGGLGVAQIVTSSFYSIVALNSSLEFLRDLTGGRLAGIPLTLRVVMQEVSPDGKKKLVPTLRLSYDQLSVEELSKILAEPPMRYILPAAQEDEVAPDDLFPASVREGRAPEMPTPTASEAPAAPVVPQVMAPAPKPPAPKDRKVLRSELLATVKRLNIADAMPEIIAETLGESVKTADMNADQLQRVIDALKKQEPQPEVAAAQDDDGHYEEQPAGLFPQGA